MNWIALITVVGVIINIALTASNLRLNHDNRRNALREHLFKEQIEFIKKFYGCLSVIIEKVDEAKLSRKFLDEDELLLEKEIDKTHNFFDQHAFILANDKMANILIKVVDAADDLYYALGDNKNNPDKADSEKFFDAYYTAIEEIREHYNIEALSSETQALTRNLRTKKPK